MAADGFFIPADQWPRWSRLLQAFERGELGERPLRPGSREPAPRSNVLALLLQDLVAAEEAEAIVLERESVDTVQMVSLFGSAEGGTFKLEFDSGGAEPEKTQDIPYDATAEVVRAAVEALPSIGMGNVAVFGGRIPHLEEDGDDYIGRWFVRFVERLAAIDVPLLDIDVSEVEPGQFGGRAGLVERTRLWDSGRRARIGADIPVGIPTPLRAGAIVTAKWVTGVGHVLDAVECREFGDTNDAGGY